MHYRSPIERAAWRFWENPIRHPIRFFSCVDLMLKQWEHDSECQELEDALETDDKPIFMKSPEGRLWAVRFLSRVPLSGLYTIINAEGRRQIVRYEDGYRVEYIR